MLKIGLIQTKVSENVPENLHKTAALIKQAARRGAELVCLPELFAHRYFAQAKAQRFFEFAQSVPGRLTKFLSECASVNRVFLIGGSIFESAGDVTFYNTSFLYDPRGRLAGKYGSIHIL